MTAPAAHLVHIQEYYFSQKLREVNQRIASGKPVINLGIGSPDLSPPAEVGIALSAALSHSKAHMYQSYQGLPELREAMASFYQTHFNTKLDPQTEILPLMGSKEGIFHISKAFLNPGDAVLIPNPGYPTYTSVTYLNHAKPIYYDLRADKGWLPDFDALEKTDLTNVKLMWISYPHMPTGANATKKDLEKMLTFAKKHQILLVNDNPYSFILNANPTSIFEIADAREHALELNSLSKTFNMAGWRVGMLLGSQAHLKEVLKVKSNMDSGMFYGIQQGAIAALKTSKNWLDNQNETYRRRREKVWEIARILGCTYDKDASGLFVWAKHPEKYDTLALVDTLLYEADVFVAPGTIFGSNGNGYIRFSLCVDMEQLQKVYDRILNLSL
ncbi:MAG: aminotransferase class I/II-fold pyridoxal phosphate-dependent enzyme [Flavobacteriaceae bacterium]|nr:aminotransferase class I/II-fold pyridoxal phosphate-dependent enzyme [Flavobacteriaceae bacterium]